MRKKMSCSYHYFAQYKSPNILIIPAPNIKQSDKTENPVRTTNIPIKNTHLKTKEYEKKIERVHAKPPEMDGQLQNNFILHKEGSQKTVLSDNLDKASVSVTMPSIKKHDEGETTSKQKKIEISNKEFVHNNPVGDTAKIKNSFSQNPPSNISVNNNNTKNIDVMKKFTLTIQVIPSNTSQNETKDVTGHVTCTDLSRGPSPISSELDFLDDLNIDDIIDSLQSCDNEEKENFSNIERKVIKQDTFDTEHETNQKTYNGNKFNVTSKGNLKTAQVLLHNQINKSLTTSTNQVGQVLTISNEKSTEDLAKYSEKTNICDDIFHENNETMQDIMAYIKDYENELTQIKSYTSNEATSKNKQHTMKNEENTIEDTEIYLKNHGNKLLNNHNIEIKKEKVRKITKRHFKRSNIKVQTILKLIEQNDIAKKIKQEKRIKHKIKQKLINTTKQNIYCSANYENNVNEFTSVHKVNFNKNENKTVKKCLKKFKKEPLNKNYFKPYVTKSNIKQITMRNEKHMRDARVCMRNDENKTLDTQVCNNNSTQRTVKKLTKKSFKKSEKKVQYILEFIKQNDQAKKRQEKKPIKDGQEVKKLINDEFIACVKKERKNSRGLEFSQIKKFQEINNSKTTNGKSYETGKINNTTLKTAIKIEHHITQFVTDSNKKYNITVKTNNSDKTTYEINKNLDEESKLCNKTQNKCNIHQSEKEHFKPQSYDIIKQKYTFITEPKCDCPINRFSGVIPISSNTKRNNSQISYINKKNNLNINEIEDSSNNKKCQCSESKYKSYNQNKTNHIDINAETDCEVKSKHNIKSDNHVDKCSTDLRNRFDKIICNKNKKNIKAKVALKQKEKLKIKNIKQNYKLNKKFDENEIKQIKQTKFIYPTLVSYLNSSINTSQKLSGSKEYLNIKTSAYNEVVNSETVEKVDIKPIQKRFSQVTHSFEGSAAIGDEVIQLLKRKIKNEAKDFISNIRVSSNQPLNQYCYQSCCNEEKLNKKIKEPKDKNTYINPKNIKTNEGKRVNSNQEGHYLLDLNKNVINYNNLNCNTKSAQTNIEIAQKAGPVNINQVLSKSNNQKQLISKHNEFKDVKPIAKKNQEKSNLLNQNNKINSNKRNNISSYDENEEYFVVNLLNKNEQFTNSITKERMANIIDLKTNNKGIKSENPLNSDHNINNYKRQKKESEYQEELQVAINKSVVEKQNDNKQNHRKISQSISAKGGRNDKTFQKPKHINMGNNNNYDVSENKKFLYNTNEIQNNNMSYQSIKQEEDIKEETSINNINNRHTNNSCLHKEEISSHEVKDLPNNLKEKKTVVLNSDAEKTNSNMNIKHNPSKTSNIKLKRMTDEALDSNETIPSKKNCMRNGLMDNNAVICLEETIAKTLKDKYDIIESIHKGSYSRVVKCTNNKGREIIVKIMHKKLDQYSKGAHKERMLNLLQENIPKEKFNCIGLLGAFIARGSWCFLHEYYSRNLDQALCDFGRGFHIDWVQELSRQLIGAVMSLRTYNIIHSNIHPGHILMDASNKNLKLCGFDDAVYESEMKFLETLGTVQYRSPEIILGVPYTYSIDVWATACTIYEMLTNTILFPGLTNNEVIYLRMCLFGNIQISTSGMIHRSAYKNQYFRGTKFRWIHADSQGYEEQEYIGGFPESKSLGKSILEAYLKDWGNKCSPVTKSSQTEKLKKITNLLKKMLELDPKKRLPIEFAYADPFIYA